MKRYQTKKRIEALNKSHGVFLSALASKFVFECMNKTEDEIKQTYQLYKSAWEVYAKTHSDKKNKIIINHDQFDTHMAEFYNRVSAMPITVKTAELNRIAHVVIEKTRTKQLASFLKNAFTNPDKKLSVIR